MQNNKKTRRLVIITFFLWMPVFGFGASQAAQTGDKTLNQIMTNIGRTMIRLYPEVFAKKSLSPKQAEAIRLELFQLQKLFEQAKPYIMKKSPTYQMSFQLLQDYFDTILSENKAVILPQLQDRLKSLSDFCVSCHTQDTKLRTLFQGIALDEELDYFTTAEFNFATRNYEVARQYYIKYLLLHARLSDGIILKTVHRLLAIDLQIRNQPARALKAIQELESARSYPPAITEYLRQLETALKTFSENKSRPQDIRKFWDLQGYVSEYLADSSAKDPVIYSTPREEVQRLWLRGQIFRYLNASPKKDEIPQLLYWLALCDRSLGFGYDYSLADFYLKQCVIRYASNPFAKRCLADYKEYLNFYFTSPNEPVLPREIADEIKELEHYLAKHQAPKK